MANEVLRLPSGIEMVMALLRYITRSAVKLTRAEITEQLLAYLPKEGGFLMETLAQEWIEEGKSIGFDLGKKEGIGQGIAAQQQTLLHLLQWRFPLSRSPTGVYPADYPDSRPGSPSATGQSVAHQPRRYRV
jgi:hypothetical protein